MKFDRHTLEAIVKERKKKKHHGFNNATILKNYFHIPSNRKKSLFIVNAVSNFLS